MLLIPNHLNIFGVSLNFYGLLIAIAIISVNSLVLSNSPKEYKDKLNNALLWVIISALICARIWHVATDFYLYSNNPIEVLYIWNGGLAIFGGLIGGGLGAILYFKRNGIPVLPSIELMAIFLPVGQMIGRLGNFVNQELYGFPTDLPWKMYIRPENRKAGFSSFEYYHPTFLYEILGNFVLFTLMYFLFKKYGIKGNGLFIAIYSCGYGIIRLVVNLYRIDPSQTSTNTSLITSGIMILGGIIWITKLKLASKT